VFGKKDNTNAIELSDIAAGIGGFVIIGESAGDYSGYSGNKDFIFSGASKNIVIFIAEVINGVF
jgi:hypothetical protein